MVFDESIHEISNEASYIRKIPYAMIFETGEGNFVMNARAPSAITFVPAGESIDLFLNSLKNEFVNIDPNLSEDLKKIDENLAYARMVHTSISSAKTYEQVKEQLIEIADILDKTDKLIAAKTGNKEIYNPDVLNSENVDKEIKNYFKKKLISETTNIVGVKIYALNDVVVGNTTFKDYATSLDLIKDIGLAIKDFRAIAANLRGFARFSNKVAMTGKLAKIAKAGKFIAVASSLLEAPSMLFELPDLNPTFSCGPDNKVFKIIDDYTIPFSNPTEAQTETNGVYIAVEGICPENSACTRNDDNTVVCIDLLELRNTTVLNFKCSSTNRYQYIRTENYSQKETVVTCPDNKVCILLNDKNSSKPTIACVAASAVTSPTPAPPSCAQAWGAGSQCTTSEVFCDGYIHSANYTDCALSGPSAYCCGGTVPNNYETCAQSYGVTEAYCQTDILGSCADGYYSVAASSQCKGVGLTAYCCIRPPLPPKTGSGGPPPNTPTPTPTPPMRITYATTDTCVDNSTEKIKFNWTRMQSGYNYEIRWTGGNKITVGDASEYVYPDRAGVAGFSPAGSVISWNVRAFDPVTETAGPDSPTFTFTVPSSCATQQTQTVATNATPTPTPKPPSPASTSTSQPVCTFNSSNDFSMVRATAKTISVTGSSLKSGTTYLGWTSGTDKLFSNFSNKITVNSNMSITTSNSKFTSSSAGKSTTFTMNINTNSSTPIGKYPLDAIYLSNSGQKTQCTYNKLGGMVINVTANSTPTPQPPTPTNTTTSPPICRFNSSNNFSVTKGVTKSITVTGSSLRSGNTYLGWTYDSDILFKDSQNAVVFSPNMSLSTSTSGFFSTSAGKSVTFSMNVNTTSSTASGTYMLGAIYLYNNGEKTQCTYNGLGGIVINVN